MLSATHDKILLHIPTLFYPELWKLCRRKKTWSWRTCAGWSVAFSDFICFISRGMPTRSSPGAPSEGTAWGGFLTSARSRGTSGRPMTTSRRSGSTWRRPGSLKRYFNTVTRYHLLHHAVWGGTFLVRYYLNHETKEPGYHTDLAVGHIDVQYLLENGVGTYLGLF